MKVTVAAAVLGISKALATPNFATFIERDRARLSAEQLLSNLYITQILKPSRPLNILSKSDPKQSGAAALKNFKADISVTIFTLPARQQEWIEFQNKMNF